MEKIRAWSWSGGELPAARRPQARAYVEQLPRGCKAIIYHQSDDESAVIIHDHQYHRQCILGLVEPQMDLRGNQGV